MKKTMANLSGIHDVRSLASTGKRSVPPSSKSVFLELYLRQNEKERLTNQEKRAAKQKKQLKKKLAAVDKAMTELFEVAVKKSEHPDKMKGSDSKSNSRTILEY